MLDTALDYLSRGWSVVPLQPRGKKPLVNWTDYQTRLATEQEVKDWWKKYPNANVGIVTGKLTGLVVVDVDTYRGAKMEPIHEEYPTALISKTGRGAYHLVYSYPKDAEYVPNQVGADGVDIRADGGLIVAPPSIHANGKRYFWTTKGTPGPAPMGLLSKREDRKTREKEEGWLSHILTEGATEGTRNDTLARLTGYLAGKNLPEDVCFALLANWNKRNDPPIKRREFERTVESVYSTHIRRLTSMTTAPEVDLPQEDIVGDPGFRLMKLEPYLSHFSDSSVSWMVDEWMPDSTIAFLVSPPGHYKTWIELDLAISVASGEPFLGKYKINKPGPVIIIQQEDHHGQTAERLAVIQRSRLNIRPENNEDGFIELDVPLDLPIYVHPDRKLRFDDDKIMRALSKTIEAIQPRLVILDPLYSAGSTDDYMAKTAEQMFAFKHLRDSTGCSFLVAHHRKKGAEGNARDGIWGSQFLNAFLETGIQVTKTSETQVKVNRHFKSEGVVPVLSLGFDISTHLPYKYNVTIDEVEEEDSTDETSSIISQLEQAVGPMTAKQLMLVTGCKRATFFRKMKSLVDDAIVVKDGSHYRIVTEEPEF